MRPTFPSRAPGPSPHGRAIGTNPTAVALVALLVGPWLGISSAESFNHVSTASSPTSSSGCRGISVPSGADLGQVMASEPAGTTYCLQAGSFEVRSTISTEVGDRVIGEGRDATFIDGSGLAPTSVGIFEVTGEAYFEDLDIAGAPTPATSDGTTCGTEAAPYRSNCGKAFSMGNASLTLRTVDCHDNGGSCIGGGGSANVTVDDLNCWNNGSAYSMTPAFRFAACIKRAAVYSGPGNTTVTNSFIHDNPWVGVWCDFCKYGFFHIQGNRFVRNGRAGVQWEMSGGWTPSDHALVKENLFQGNNYLKEEIGADVVISSANDIVVTSNVFTEERRTSIGIVFTTSRNPPQPRGVGVVIEDNMVDPRAIIGCGAASYAERFASILRSDLTLGLLGVGIILALILGLLFRSYPRLLLVGFASVILVSFLVVSTLVLLQGSAALCINNA